MRYLILTCLIVLAGCARKPLGVFDANDVPAKPDYSNPSNWAALPERLDAADVLLDTTFQDVQAHAAVDVFFLHPTTYLGKKGERAWNAALENQELNARTDSSTIKYQASIFNGVGRVYAPRYRQMQLQVYDEFEGKKANSAYAAAQLAYGDVKVAFEYYLKHYNDGRPIIIASHSQGTTHSKQLMKDFFDGKALQDQLIAAYLIGIKVAKDEFDFIPACETANQTGCFTSWRTFQTGYEPKAGSSFGDSILVTNPINWKIDATYAPSDAHLGAIITDKHPLYRNIVDAKVNQQYGILWMTRPKYPARLRFFPGKNFHIGDMNLYYLDIRANAQKRTATFLKNGDY